MPSLVIESASLDFPAHEGRRGFTLRIPRLEFAAKSVVFIMGHNGSGKSMYLSLVAGERYLSDGVPLRVESWTTGGGRSTVLGPHAVVRQRAEDSVAMSLSVFENVVIRHPKPTLLESLRPRSLLRNWVTSRLTGYPMLQERLMLEAEMLSSGQRQALAFALATTRRTQLLLLDEFLSATDLSTTEFLTKMVRSYVESNGSVALVVSHDPELALRVADRILVLSGGTLLSDIQRSDVSWRSETLLSLLSPLREESSSTA